MELMIIKWHNFAGLISNKYLSKIRGVEMKKKEKRFLKRFNTRFSVYDSEGNLLGFTKNISASGCFLETKKIVNRDAMKISIELPGMIGRIKMECKVIRNEKEGIGMKLLMDEEHIKNFLNILENLPY